MNAARALETDLFIPCKAADFTAHVAVRLSAICVLETFMSPREYVKNRQQVFCNVIPEGLGE